MSKNPDPTDPVAYQQWLTDRVVSHIEASLQLVRETFVPDPAREGVTTRLEDAQHWARLSTTVHAAGLGVTPGQQPRAADAAPPVTALGG